MGAIASQITSLTIVYSTVYSDADQRKHQSSASLNFVQGIHRGPVNSPHKWPVTRKMFPFDDVIMLLQKSAVRVGPCLSGNHRHLNSDLYFKLSNISNQSGKIEFFLYPHTLNLFITCQNLQFLASMFVCRFVTCQNLQFLASMFVCRFVCLSVCLLVCQFCQA